MEDSYARAFDAYYSLKRQYDTQLARQKKQIASNAALSLSEKQAAIRELVPKCVNCKRQVGTAFKQEGKRLTAFCGDSKDPCSLDIDITRGGYERTSEMRRFFRELTDLKKTQIVEAKMQLLFGYQTEDESVEAFETLVKEYKESEDMLTTIESGVSDVVNDIEKQAALDAKELELYKEVQTIKDLTSQYEADPRGNPGANKAVAEIMTSTVPLLNEQIRGLKFSTNRVVFNDDDGTYHLDQVPYQLGEIEIDLFDKPVVTKNKTGK